jgi:hypothetical protein
MTDRLLFFRLRSVGYHFRGAIGKKAVEKELQFRAASDARRTLKLHLTVD